LTKNNNYIFPYTVFPFFIMPPNKDWLYNRIQIRLNKMLTVGFQKEVENLFYRGDLHLNLPSMRCIGYRQMWEYLEYNINYAEMYHRIIYATRKLAKHQLTWLNKLKSLYILKAQNSHILSKIILYTIKKNINKYF
ncbi:MAG: tRNA (adenosine(37)-N6)-dimethylallyltransferase MiaA, partial [Buchnera aphidicola]|nr:tRNA (adenosine(37)-N6)-dimethylallyltransferase MiaA [Buchnera aphidicola]